MKEVIIVPHLSKIFMKSLQDDYFRKISTERYYQFLLFISFQFCDTNSTGKRSVPFGFAICKPNVEPLLRICMLSNSLS